MSTNRNGSRPCLVFLFKAYYAFGGAVVKRPVLSIRSDFWTLRDGTYRWEERPGPAPDDKRSSMPPFRVVLAFPEDEPAMLGGVAKIDSDITSYRFPRIS